MAKKELSILMPSFNNTCVGLVKELVRQCSIIDGLNYEILVADDGSTDLLSISKNREINEMVNCRYIERNFNAGRAPIRNFLIREAKYELILFLDSDVSVENDDFINIYLGTNCDGVIYGGVHNSEKAYDTDNLRCVYECAFEKNNNCDKRNVNPYQSFRTTNFMALRSVMLKFPFDEGFKEYGYEDVLFGKTLKENKISLKHIDNPIVIDEYDTNEEFLEKTRQALRTLHKFRDDLKGYSGILSAEVKLRRCLMTVPMRFIYNVSGKRLYNRLCGCRPSIFLYNVYRLLYFISLK